MKKETYSIPITPTAFNEFQRNAVNKLKTNATAWGIPPEKMINVDKLFVTYEKAYMVAVNNKTQNPIATSARNRATEKLTEALAEIYNRWIMNSVLITNEEKLSLYVAYKAERGTSAAAPVTTPVVSLKCEEISVLHVVFSDSASVKGNSHAKPTNVAFCELWYKINASPEPEKPTDCPERCNISRSHACIIFETEQRGKTIAGFSRWVNKNGKTGPWSDRFHGIVP